MKIALVHNFYQQPGGEDQFFYREGDLLESRGHTVVRYTRHNDDLRGRSRLHMAADSVWNSSEYRWPLLSAPRCWFRSLFCLGRGTGNGSTISLRPSLITEHHFVSSLNDLARGASPSCRT